jgi:hypothetical protein
MGINAQQVMQNDPDFLRRQMAQQEMQRLNPTGGAAGAIGAVLGRGLGNVSSGRGFFDTSDPALKKVTDLQSIYNNVIQEVGAENPLEAFKRLSKEFASAGYGKEALAASQEADKFQRAEIERQREEASLKKAELSAAQEAQMRKELADLGPNATEDQVLSIVTKYGAPDKIMAALSAKQSREAALEQRREVAQQRLDIARQGLDFKKELQNTKVEAANEKQAAAAKEAINNAGRVIQTVTEAKSLVGPFTTGAGGFLSVVPGTDAKKLANKISTIKANLGFDRLQQMRDASPTGGALGQVAVQEINFLQSTVQTLDQLESTADITDALNKIEEYYSNWKTALEGRIPAKYQTGGGVGAVPTASATPTAQPQSPASLPPGVSVKKVR